MNSKNLILLTDHNSFVYFIITRPLAAPLPFSVRQRKWPRSVTLVLVLSDLLLGTLPNCLRTSEEIILKHLTFSMYRNGPMQGGVIMEGKKFNPLYLHLSLYMTGRGTKRGTQPNNCLRKPNWWHLCNALLFKMWSFSDYIEKNSRYQSLSGHS